MEERSVKENHTTKEKVLFLCAYNLIYIFYFIDNRHKPGNIFYLVPITWGIRFNSETLKARRNIHIFLNIHCAFQNCSYMNLIPWRTFGHRKIRYSNRPWIEGWNIPYMCKSRSYSETRSMKTRHTCRQINVDYHPEHGLLLHWLWLFGFFLLS